MTTLSNDKGQRSAWSLIKQSLNGEHLDFTTGSIKKAVFLLAVPMILEMVLESVFALVDIIFVGKLGPNAVAAVGTTESFLTIVYSVGIGLSMGATALVARRVGEKNDDAASKAGAQALLICFGVSVLISLAGLFFAEELLRLIGAGPDVVETGHTFTRIMLGGNIVIMLLFLINGIFRGAGNAAIAMRSLWLANLCNIVLCPVCIHFWGLPGAAIANTTGRGIGVCYQVYLLAKGKGGKIKLHLNHFVPDIPVLKSIVNIASTATLQFIIGSASWMALMKILSAFGRDAVAGYTIAIRLLIFFLMPAWGLSNAAATLVGQNLGAQKPDRAEKSVWKTAQYNAIFMGTVSLLFIIGAEFFVGFIPNDGNAEVTRIAATALRTVSFGYIFYGVGMVMINAFNGAGDSRTPTWINLFWFWIFQIPFAYLMSNVWGFGIKGVFLAIVITETCIATTSILVFKRGKWKTIKV